MEFMGKLTGISKEIMSDAYHVTFTTLDDLSDCGDYGKDLRVTAKVFRHRRSLDANSYCWALVSEIASVLRASKEEVYEHLIFKYGHLMGDTEESSAIMSGHNVPIAAHFHAEHLYPKKHSTVTVEGLRMDLWLIYRGSSTYDTKEMASFIDGIVQDAKELGIDTVPTVELEKIKEKWHL